MKEVKWKQVGEYGNTQRLRLAKGWITLTVSQDIFSNDKKYSVYINKVESRKKFDDKDTAKEFAVLMIGNIVEMVKADLDRLEESCKK